MTRPTTRPLGHRYNLQPPTTNLQPKSKALSGKPDDAAKKILEHLNTVCGTKYRPVAHTLKHIKARIAEFDVETLLRVIDYKHREWKNTEMSKYLRPDTLFNATKCASYVGQLDVPIVKTNGKGEVIPQAPSEKLCGKCGKPLKGGHTFTQQWGNICSPCWNSR